MHALLGFSSTVALLLNSSKELLFRFIDPGLDTTYVGLSYFVKVPFTYKSRTNDCLLFPLIDFLSDYGYNDTHVFYMLIYSR